MNWADHHDKRSKSWSGTSAPIEPDGGICSGDAYGNEHFPWTFQVRTANLK